MPAAVLFEALAGGDPNASPVGAHVLLEANGGALLNAVRMPDGLVAFRGGRVQHFQVARALPAATAVIYPPPFGLPTDAEAIQAIERARGLVGLSAVDLAMRLEGAGAQADELATGGEAAMSECLCSFCTTGVAKYWRVTQAYHARMHPASKPEALLEGSTAPPQTQSSALAAPLAPASGNQLVPVLAESKLGAAEGNAETAIETSAAPRSQLSHTIREKAVHTAVHVGLRGSAAKIAGAAAAIGCEGYALYQDVGGHSEKLQNNDISKDQFQERVAESTITSSGRAIGGLAGAAAGQAAIPVPLVGAVIGGVLGAGVGGLHANSFARGAFRLSGSKARGGDDLVRCIEHKPAKYASGAFAASSEPAAVSHPAAAAAAPPAAAAAPAGIFLADEEQLL